MSKFGIFKKNYLYGEGNYYIVKKKLFGFIPIYVNFFPDGILAWENYVTEEVRPIRFDSIEEAKIAIDFFKKSEIKDKADQRKAKVETLVEEI